MNGYDPLGLACITVNEEVEMRAGCRDLVESVRRKDVWLFFAVSDTKARYARSTLGPWWITLGTLLGVVGLGLVWSAVMKLELAQMLPNLAVGLVLWFMIAGIISESPQCYVNQGGIIRNYSLPLMIHNLRLMSKHVVNFFHNLSIVVVVFAIYHAPSFFDLGWGVLGFIIILFNLAWLSVLLSLMGARFRDLGPTVDALMPVMFFLTPILYKKSDVIDTAVWFSYNPIANLFSLVKDPMLSLPHHPENYLAMFGLGIVGWCIALMVLSRTHKKVVFWI